MSPHVSLPTASEIDFDITESISGNTCSGTSKGVDLPLGTKLSSLDVGTILDPSINIDGEDDETFIEAQRAALNRKASNIKGKANKKSSGFQSMGLDAHLMKAIIRKGFNVPTPIQRKTIPLILDHQDVVGMARTGSGKTAAFVIPMIQKLKAHSARVGARALILSPSRELALQTLKVVKELSRGTDLKCVLLVGGDSLEDQFRFMAANPDIIIATPGRFLHLKIEMSLDISSVKYVVFDEADRLFEMGFSIQLNEILHALSSSRQTLLFSATLPRSLVEFAKAGLQEPSLVRLDAESKVSTDLESAFFSVKSAEKEAALLYILNDLIKVPTETGQADSTTSENNKKRKRAIETKSKKMPTEHSTIVFAATKHHVEYLAEILRLSGFTVSHAYGSLDQVARNIQVENFRTGVTNILVVTDVAARGIDIPILANVINYDFPPQPKVFVHRVGRTARAGQRGWSYSLVRDTDAPYLLDLQLFLGRRLLLGRDADISTSFAKDIIVGCLPRDKIESITEWATNMINGNDDLNALRSVAGKGERLYIKTRNSASSESIKRAKEIISSKNWSQLHLLFQDESSEKEHARIDMLARVSDFRPPETIFEVGTKGKSHYSEIANIMRQRRAKINPIKQKVSDRTSVIQEKIERIDDNCVHNLIGDKNLLISEAAAGVDVLSDDEVSDDELEVTFSKNYQKDKDRSRSWKDSENFISYTPKNINIAEERGYGVHSGSYNTASQNSNFLQTARDLVMDLANDDSGKSFSEPTKAKGMRWDKKNSKYVSRANDEDGSKGVRMIRSESGQKIAASFKSGRFDKWRKANKFDRLPRIGELEKSGTTGTKLDLNLSTRYKHKQTKEPKEADPFRDDFHIRKKRVAEAKEKRIGRWRDGTGKQEIRTTDDIRKQRKLAERKKAKNARPVKKTRK